MQIACTANKGEEEGGSKAEVACRGHNMVEVDQEGPEEVQKEGVGVDNDGGEEVVVEVADRLQDVAGVEAEGRKSVEVEEAADHKGLVAVEAEACVYDMPWFWKVVDWEKLEV